MHVLKIKIRSQGISYIFFRLLVQTHEKLGLFQPPKRILGVLSRENFAGVQHLALKAYH